MVLGRRDFLKYFAGLAGLCSIQPFGAAKQVIASTKSNSVSDLAMVVDVTKCIGCWWCYAACKNYYHLPETMKPNPEQAPQLSPGTWTTLYTVKTGDEWWQD